MMSHEATLHIHLLCLSPRTRPSTFFSHFPPKEILIKGRPHGWVHRPHITNRDRLLNHSWDLFLVTLVAELPAAALESAKEHLSFETAVPVEQYDALLATTAVTPTASSNTPPLPGVWSKGGIPTDAVLSDKGAELAPGELRLDESMSRFLSKALPREFANAPVSLFNLFKYKNGDRSIHDAYMSDFKNTFGDSAGASVKFMGVVDGSIRDQTTGSGDGWQDTNLVQYDSIWHYAYMLSTKEYQEMNKIKVDGLEDTCILCVSEVELCS